MVGRSWQYAFMASIACCVALAGRNGKGQPYSTVKMRGLIMFQARVHYLETDDPTLQAVDRVPEEFHDPIHHQALAFDYFAEAYIAFFHGADAFDEQEKALEARYGGFIYPISGSSLIPPQAKKNERVANDLEEQTERRARIKAEFEQLQSSAVGIMTLLRIWTSNLPRLPSRNCKKTMGFLSVTERSSMMFTNDSNHGRSI
jgi:SMC interacting uncharacterized protein involved in chromosome segregation